MQIGADGDTGSTTTAWVKKPVLAALAAIGLIVLLSSLGAGTEIAPNWINTTGGDLAEVGSLDGGGNDISIEDGLNIKNGNGLSLTGGSGTVNVTDNGAFYVDSKPTRMYGKHLGGLAANDNSNAGYILLADLSNASSNSQTFTSGTFYGFRDTSDRSDIGNARADVHLITENRGSRAYGTIQYSARDGDTFKLVNVTYKNTDYAALKYEYGNFQGLQQIYFEGLSESETRPLKLIDGSDSNLTSTQSLQNGGRDMGYKVPEINNWQYPNNYTLQAIQELLDQTGNVYIKLEPGKTYSGDFNLTANLSDRNDNARHIWIDARGAMIDHTGNAGGVIHFVTPYQFSGRARIYGGGWSGPEETKEGTYCIRMDDSFGAVLKPQTVGDCYAGIQVRNKKKWNEAHEIGFLQTNGDSTVQAGGVGERPMVLVHLQGGGADPSFSGTKSFRAARITIPWSRSGKNGGEIGFWNEKAKIYNSKVYFRGFLPGDGEGIRLDGSAYGSIIDMATEGGNENTTALNITSNAKHLPMFLNTDGHGTGLGTQGTAVVDSSDDTAISYGEEGIKTLGHGFLFNITEDLTEVNDSLRMMTDQELQFGDTKEAHITYNSNDDRVDIVDSSASKDILRLDTAGQWVMVPNGKLRVSGDSFGDALFVSGGDSILTGGSVRHQDGASGSPAITFNNDQDTGLYRSGENAVTFTNGGTKSINITASHDVDMLGNNITMSQMYNMTQTSGNLPTCDSGLSGAVMYNGSGHWGCHSNSWNPMY